MDEDNNLFSRLVYEGNFFDKNIEQLQIQDKDLIVNKSPEFIRNMELLLEIDLSQGPKNVLDCGCSTGYLSVLSAKHGMNDSHFSFVSKSFCSITQPVV